jgi:ATP-dependent Clp protease ATP-binding subunit ClpA
MQPTDPNKFTEKAWSAIARTPDIAKQAQNQHLESEHLMLALLEQEGLATSILISFPLSPSNCGNGRKRLSTVSLRYPAVARRSTSASPWKPCSTGPITLEKPMAMITSPSST